MKRFALSLTVLLAGCSVDPHETRNSQTGAAVHQDADEDDSVLYFFSPGCPDCQEIDREVMPLLADMGVDVRKLDAAQNFRNIQKVERRFGVEFEVLAPNMIYDGQVLSGKDKIMRFFLEGES